jgi:hypothetical protein
MTDPSWCVVCAPESAIQVGVGHLCKELKPAKQSPIDDYYEYVEHVLTLGQEEDLKNSSTLGRLVLLGLVSGVETYFRAILAELLRQCPLARRCAADQMIPFGAVSHYGPDSVALALFDTGSLAGADEVVQRTRKLLGLDIPKDSPSLLAALSEYDKICHLRHAAVHARGNLARRNLMALEIGATSKQLALEVSLAGLHEAGAACHSVVRAYNRFTYRRTVERWIGNDLLSGSWQLDKSSFQPLFDLFRSKRDAVGPARAYDAYRGLPARS